MKQEDTQVNLRYFLLSVSQYEVNIACLLFVLFVLSSLFCPYSQAENHTGLGSAGTGRGANGDVKEEPSGNYTDRSAGAGKNDN